MSAPLPGQSAAAARHDAEADEALMLRYCAGDAQAFETLYRRHKEGSPTIPWPPTILRGPRAK